MALARELVRLGARVVVVGGTARLLRDGDGDPGDLDLVVADVDLPDLVAALVLLGSPATVPLLERGRCVHLATSWGPLDVFVAEPPRCSAVTVDGVDVHVAA